MNKVSSYNVQMFHWVFPHQNSMLVSPLPNSNIKDATKLLSQYVLASGACFVCFYNTVSCVMANRHTAIFHLITSKGLLGAYCMYYAVIFILYVLALWPVDWKLFSIEASFYPRLGFCIWKFGLRRAGGGGQSSFTKGITFMRAVKNLFISTNGAWSYLFL
jgi:hypothetical protein